MRQKTLDEIIQERKKIPNCKMPFCEELATVVLLMNGQGRGRYCKHHGVIIAPTYKKPGLEVKLMNLKIYNEMFKND